MDTITITLTPAVHDALLLQARWAKMDPSTVASLALKEYLIHAGWLSATGLSVHPRP